MNYPMRLRYYLFLVCIIVLLGCDDTVVDPQPEAIEIISQEVNFLKTRSASFVTVAKINLEYEERPQYGYLLYISENEEPDGENSVGFDKTDEEGGGIFDENQATLTISSPISELESNTLYYYKIILSFNEYTKESEILTFSTLEEEILNGGITYYDKGEYSDGWRYLAAAPLDWYSSEGDPLVIFGCNGTDIANTNYRIGFGLSNTNRFLDDSCSKSTGVPTALSIIDTLSLNDYQDWFIPSFDEMVRLIRSDDIKIEEGRYWSSTQLDTIIVNCIDYWGYGDHCWKDEPAKLRPVRRY